MNDQYRTLQNRAEYEEKIERSTFLAIAFPATTEQAVQSELSSIQKKYFDATHHCWEVRLFGDGVPRERSSDAGEPGGSAGRPILSAIAGADLFDCAVVVVRWYGGVKLGTGGLSRAYRGTAAEALKRAQVSVRYVYCRFEATVPFDHLNTIYRMVSPPAVILVGEDFAETNRFSFDVRASAADAFAADLTNRRIDFIRIPSPAAPLTPR